MDEDVKKELESLRAMVLAWKESYIKLAMEERGGSEYLVREYSAEIEEMVFPYVYKIMRLGGMDAEELNTFMVFCQTQVYELREALTLAEMEVISEKEEDDARKV